jgi:hypothetical protein
MSFGIQKLHIADNSPEGQVIAAIVSRDDVSPSEAVLTALRGLAAHEPFQTSKDSKKPGELLFGIFADEPEVMRQIATNLRAARDREIEKGFRG